MRGLSATVLCALPLTSIALDTYDEHVLQIEHNARNAFALHNAGRVQEAYAALDGARESFRAAKRMQPAEPQAYITLGTALLNANQLDEALPLWRKAQKLTDDDGLRAWLQGRERWTRYGKVSMLRDRVYAEGQGDLPRALKLMEKQLKIYPASPKLLHDQATAYSMVSEIWPDNATSAAITRFTEAQGSASLGWRSGVQKRGRASQECAQASGTTEGVSLVYDWRAWHARGDKERGALVAMSSGGKLSETHYGPEHNFRDDAGYVATFKDVGLSGDDGVIVDEGMCNIFIPSSGIFVDLATNLQLLEVWGDPPSPEKAGSGSPQSYSWYTFGRGPDGGAIKDPRWIPKAASVVQFAGTSHFHVLTEVLGRLLLLQRHDVFTDPELQLITNVDLRRGKGFLSTALALLLPQFPANRILWWERGGAPDVRVRIGHLQFANWEEVAAPSLDGGHCATPRSILADLRQTLRSAWAPSRQEQPTPGIVFASRKGTTDMRSKFKDEVFFIGALRKMAVAAKPSPHPLTEFNGGLSPVETAVLFGHAFAVVGVHGGALTNILFCQPDAQLFELGFSTPFAGHYRHLAAAIGMKFTLLPLVADARGIGAAEVRLVDPKAAIQVMGEALFGQGEVVGERPSEGKREL